MKKVFYAKMVRVRPLPRSRMSKSNPNVEGAYVDCFVSASTFLAAKRKLVTTLRQDKYEVLDFKKIIDFSKCKAADKKASEEYKAMAWDAFATNGVVYGPFHCW